MAPYVFLASCVNMADSLGHTTRGTQTKKYCVVVSLVGFGYACAFAKVACQRHGGGGSFDVGKASSLDRAVPHLELGVPCQQQRQVIHRGRWQDCVMGHTSEVPVHPATLEINGAGTIASLTIHSTKVDMLTKQADTRRVCIGTNRESDPRCGRPSGQGTILCKGLSGGG